MIKHINAYRVSFTSFSLGVQSYVMQRENCSGKDTALPVTDEGYIIIAAESVAQVEQLTQKWKEIHSIELLGPFVNQANLGGLGQ